MSANNGFPFLTADAILGAVDLKHEEAVVPEWGGKVIVRELTSAERDEWEAAVHSQQQAASIADRFRNIRALLVVRCIMTEGGERMFSDDKAEALGKKSAAAVQRLFNIASRLNAISKSDTDDLAKNSEGAPAGDSPSS